MKHASTMPWTLQSIDFSLLDTARMRQQDDLMCLLCASSFIESGSDLYTRNLVEHFREQPEIRSWLIEHWEPEELQHGRALRHYVEQVWPELDWQAAYDGFMDEYAEVCRPELLEPLPGLEMAARCVVEMGTATLYRAIHESIDEPVLKTLTGHIKSDEVRHYSYFYRYFRQYQQEHHHGRLQVMRTLLRRLREIGNEDGRIALRHVFAHRHPEYLQDKTGLREASDRIYRHVRAHLAPEMAVKMLIKPLALPPRVHAGLQPPLTWAARHLITLH